jgi:hypothetical protein
MNCNNIILIILFIVILMIIYLLDKMNKIEQTQKEKFTQSSMTITESIKNLGLIAKKIYDAKGTYTFPADVVITGSLKVKGFNGIKAYREVSVYDNNNHTGSKISMENKMSNESQIYSQKNLKIIKNTNNITIDDNRVTCSKELKSNIRVKAGDLATMETITQDNKKYAQFKNSSDINTYVRVGDKNVILGHSESDDKGVLIVGDNDKNKGRIMFSLMRAVQDKKIPDARKCFQKVLLDAKAGKDDILLTRRNDGHERMVFLHWHPGDKGKKTMVVEEVLPNQGHIVPSTETCA